MGIQECNKLGFSSKQKGFSNKQVLVVGEGDFSLSLSFAKAFGATINITATSLDIREELGRNYDNGKGNVEELERLGSVVVRSVNVHSMTSDDRLARYDIIIFVFTRAGMHPKVVRGFLKRAREMMKDKDGEILMFHKTMYPFDERDLKALAKESGLRLNKQMRFSQWARPYYDKRGSGSDCDFVSSFGSSAVVLIFKT